MMKTTLYIPLLMLVATLTAACTKHTPEAIQPVMPSGSYIFFEPEVLTSIEARTTMVEGTSLPSASGTAFGVFGYCGSSPIFTHENYGEKHIANVQRESEGGRFSYKHLAQWKDASSPHHFYAFYPYSICENVTTTATSQSISYQQPTNQTSMVDILTAKASVSKDGLKNEPVSLGFTHRLWALDVSVMNSQEKDYVTYPNGDIDTKTPNLYIIDAKIYIHGFRKAGNISIGDNSINGKTETADKTEAVPYDLFTASVTTPSIMVESKKSHTFAPLLFLPVSNTFAYRLEIKFRNAWGASYDYYYPAPTIDSEGNKIYGYKTLDKSFEAGKRYSLQVEKNDASGSFNINWDVNDWENKGVDHTFN